MIRVLLCALCCVFGQAAWADTRFPDDAGFINVRDFGAKGDGKTDDTAAINAALTASGGDTGPLFWQNKITYFPDGVYRVSAPIVKRYENGKFASGAIMVGQSRERTIIRLADHAEGYGDPQKPKAVIFTTAKLLDGNATSGGKDYPGKGEGNDAFANFIENMTVDAGNHMGAIGIDYLANNLGAVRNVLVRGNGVTGIALARKWPGPALLQDVRVEGVAVGIDAAHTEYGMTLDHVTLSGQGTIGLRNDHNIISANGLRIEKSPLSLLNQSPDGLVVLVGGTIERFDNRGYLHARGVAVDGNNMDGVYAQDTLLGASTQGWSLTAKNAPSPNAESPKNWMAVRGFHADAIEEAFSSGAATIYLPHGVYEVDRNIVVPAHIRRIVGMMSTIRPLSTRAPAFKRDLGLLRARNDESPLVIEKLAFDNSNMGDQVAIEALGAKPLVLRDVVGAGVTTVARPVHGGELFLENTCCGTFDIAGKKGVWAKQLNTEGFGTRIRNRGAPLWVLGIKTEQNCTVVHNEGGISELLGGLIYMVKPPDTHIPAFRNQGGKILLSYGEEAFKPEATYTTHVLDNGTSIAADTLPKRSVGRMAPLLIGGN